MSTIRQKELEKELFKYQSRKPVVVLPDSIEFEMVSGTAIPAVYVVRSEQYYKIGHTNVSVSKRLATLQIGNPHKISLVYAIFTARYKELEKKLHDHFKHRHYRGEWFKLLPEDEVQIEKYLAESLWQTN